MVSGKVSKRNGQIGVAGGFAVFPDLESGRKALQDSLMNTHGEKDLENMIEVYAPKHENNTSLYLRFLRKRTGVTDNKKIKDFNPEEFKKLWEAIEEMEGKKKPIIVPENPLKKQITAVRKNKKGTIVSYYVEKIGWLSKTKGIALTKKGELDSVISTSRSGNQYLKTRPDAKFENNLENMG